MPDFVILNEQGESPTFCHPETDKANPGLGDGLMEVKAPHFCHPETDSINGAHEGS
ncbi:MAG: hypothetical protein WBJ17_08405 [Natronincolaceae bacterium]